MIRRLSEKRVLCLFAIWALLLLSACQRQQGDTIIRFGMANQPSGFDPRYATDATSARINQLLYQSLVRLDQNGRAKPELASWQMLSPRHFRFHLIDKTVFHHGKALDMADVQATYQSVLHGSKISPHRASFSHVQSIHLIDKDTLDFYLARDDILFPALLTLGILPADLLQKHHPFHTQPVGSGVFRFIAWPEPQKVVLQRNKDGQRFELLTVKDPTVRILKLMHGEIDLLQNNLQTDQVRYLKGYPGMRYMEGPGSTYSYIGMNLADPLLSRRNIRRAIAYALNRRQIIHHFLSDNAELAYGFFPSYHWLATSKQLAWDYQPQRAKQLLKQEGYDQNYPLRLSFKTSNNPFSIRKATIFQYQLQQVGIKLKIQSYDWGTFYADIKKGRFQLYSLDWVGVNAPDIYRYVFHSGSIPPTGANRGRLQDNSVDQLIEQAEQALRIDQKQQLYRQLQQRVRDQLVYIPLWYMRQFAFFSGRIQGYQLYPDGSYQGLEQVSLKN